MANAAKAITIQDVAHLANVSTATVSRALSSPEKVSESTRARISEAVRISGYTLNQTARSLRQRMARTILVALPDIRNAFFSEILDAIEREAALRDYGVLIANLFIGDDPAKRLEHYFLSHRADGLLLLDGTIDLRQLAGLSALPVVVACEDIPNSTIHTVITDNALAAERITRHLIDLGHRKIGHIGGPDGNIVAHHRRTGFLKALAAAGLAIEQQWQFEGSFAMHSGYAAAGRFAALAEKPTAIFAVNDESAIGFLSGARERGIECPRDISVVGFDDLEVASHYVPPLTTMRQPREALGRLAAETLIDMLENGGATLNPTHIVLTSDLVIRGSTGRPMPELAAVDRIG